MTAIERDRTPWVVTAVLAVVLFGGLGYLYAIREEGPGSVQEVADRAVEAVSRYDVRAGGRLLCDPLTEEQRLRLEALVQTGRERADDPDPELDIVISDVRGSATGSFRVRVTSPLPGLVGIFGSATVLVAERDGRSCVAGLADEDYQGGLDPH